MARDIAEDHLNSCAPQTILFTSADNDTYPLWYAQEVENIRPDVRVIVTSLLGTDWMIDQMKTRVNQSDPIPFSWSHDKYVGDNRNYIPYYDKGPVSKDSVMSLQTAMAFMGSDSNRLQSEGGESLNYLPTKNLYLSVDKATVLDNGTVPKADSAEIPSRIAFTFPGNNLLKNDMAELNVAAANHWERPISFTYPPYNLGLENYVEDQGLAYRLTPVKPHDANGVDLKDMYTNLMTKFKFGGGEKPDIYFDENGRRELLSIRGAYISLGGALAASGSRDSALKVLNYGYKMIDPSTLSYGMVSTGNMQDISSLQYANAFYQAGDTKRSLEIANAVIRDCRQQLAYYNSLGDNASNYFQRDQQTASAIIEQMERLVGMINGSGKPLK